MDLPNPFHNVVEVACPECGPILIALKIIIVLLLVFVVGKYFSKNRIVLAAVAVAAMYFLFA